MLLSVLILSTPLCTYVEGVWLFLVLKHFVPIGDVLMDINQTKGIGKMIKFRINFQITPIFSYSQKASKNTEDS